MPAQPHVASGWYALKHPTNGQARRLSIRCPFNKWGRYDLEFARVYDATYRVDRALTRRVQPCVGRRYGTFHDMMRALHRALEGK